MDIVFGGLISWFGLLLLCISQRGTRARAAARFRGSTAVAMRWLGFAAFAAGAGYLMATNPGDLGLVAWFGLHPLLILAISLLAAVSFRALVWVTSATPLLLLIVGLVWRGI